MRTGIRTRIDERLVGSGVFVSMRELCVGGTTLWSCGGVDFLWLRSICVLSGAIHTCACTSLVWSSTREQNTSLTLITHFSHLNKACLTPHISSVQTPSGIHSSLHFCLPLLLQPLYLSLPVTPLVLLVSGIYFYFFCAAQKVAPGEHYF